MRLYASKESVEAHPLKMNTAAARLNIQSMFNFLQEQFEYLYDAAAEYIKSFNTYANFAWSMTDLRNILY